MTGERLIRGVLGQEARRLGSGASYEEAVPPHAWRQWEHPKALLYGAPRRPPDGEARDAGAGGAGVTNTVFFSWQSDPGETRGVVQAALDKAVRNLNLDLALEEALRLDEDTAGVAG